MNFIFTKLLSLFLAGELVVCATISPNESSGQPVQDVSADRSSPSLDDPNKINWLSENAIPIRSVDPDDDDFSDLLPFKSLLDGVRVVMLGEASHGDGATFYAKQRLIRFLHEEMGFNVLAWEERFFAMEEIGVAEMRIIHQVEWNLLPEASKVYGTIRVTFSVFSISVLCQGDIGFTNHY